jgi:hypothetical protein
MATYNFPDSIAPAITFATKLLAGTLNMQPDYEHEDCRLVNLTRETSWFSTEIMKRVRIMFQDYELSRIEATDIAENPNSLASRSEIRHITVFAKNRRGMEAKVAAFDIQRDYLDGDTVAGWTRWNVRNVLVQRGEIKITLASEQIDRHDDYVVWGQVVHPQA